MTSPGIKRPLEYETEGQTTGLSASVTSPKNATGGETDQNEAIKNELMDDSNSSTSASNNASTNGSKRRCTANNNFLSANNQQLILASSVDTESQVDCKVETINNTSSESIFKDSSSSLSPLSDIVANLIKDELLQASSQNDSHSFEPPILNASQTQSICEKLVKQRETKLRDEYNKILTRKLAEQYDTFAKHNYTNSFGDPSRRMPSSVNTTTLATAPTTTAAPPNATSMNAFAATLQMQRSVQSQPIVTSSAPNSINDSHHMSYNSYQQQAAAAAAAAAAIQHHHQQQRGHHQQQQQLGHQQSQHLSVQHRMTPNSMGQINPALAGSIIPFGPVLLTSNLDEQLAVPEALFTLFGVFGDVVRVKILFNKKDNALIQMADATQAQVAQSYLDKQRIFGKIVRVTRSKHLLVQMPREGNQSDAGLTKDFTNSPLHRFKIPGSRNYLNIYPPSNTLHISNIPASVDEKDLQKAFKEECGFEFTSFKFFPKERKMALMKFASTENATIALIKMHNFQISEENNLRVSFSKTSI